MKFAQHVRCRNEKFGAVVFDTLREKVFVTEETGQEILALLGEGLEEADIVARLSQRYAGDAGRIAADTAAFLHQVREAGLLAADAPAAEVRP